MFRPHGLFLRASRIGSITRRKRTGERTEPCLTPRLMGKALEEVSEILTQEELCEYDQ